MTEQIRGGHILARALKDKGIDQVFTLSGGFCNAALEGLMECGVDVVNTPHEQIAGFLADGYTRLTRKPTVCFVGPEGFANAVGSMIEAWGARSPVIYITSSSTQRRKGAGGFKEIDDVSVAAPLTKYSVSVTDGVRIREFVDRAFKIATGGYPGAVHLSVPVDIMFASYPADAGQDERPTDWGATPAPRAWPDPAALAPVLDLLAGARRPMFIAGYGVWWSRTEGRLGEVTAELNIPVFNMSEHQKVLSQSAPSYMGMMEVHQNPPAGDAIAEADVIVAIGCVLDNTLEFGNPPLFPKDTPLVCVNGSDEEIQFNHGADRALLSDPGAFLDALGALKAAGRWTLGSEWLARNQQRRRDWAEKTLAKLAEADDALAGGSGATGRGGDTIGKVHPLHLSLEVQKLLGENDFLVYDGGNTHFWAEIGVNVAGSQGQKLAGIVNVASYSLLGVGVPWGIAAKRLHPDSRVVVISGDGAFMAGGMSIEVAFEENVPVVVVIDNNMGLDCISEQQERMFPHRAHFATDFRNIPFHTMVEGLGGHGELVTEVQEIGPAVLRALASGKPAVVNVMTKGVITPVIEDVTMRRDNASIE